MIRNKDDRELREVQRPACCVENNNFGKTKK